MATIVTVAPSAGVPVQPVIPFSFLFGVSTLEYEQVPVTPGAVNLPVGLKSSVEATTRLPWLTFCPAVIVVPPPTVPLQPVTLFRCVASVPL